MKLFCATERQNISEKSFFYHKTVFLELDPPFLKRDRVSIQIFLLRAAAQALGVTKRFLYRNPNLQIVSDVNSFN